MVDETLRHYGRLATDYDNNWTYNQTHSEEFTSKLRTSIDLHRSDHIANLGCGTGLYTAEIHRQLKPEHPILRIDPSAEMLANIPIFDSLRPVLSSAEEISPRAVLLPISEPLDVIINKEAIHHVRHRIDIISGLTDPLAPGGRMLMAILPTSIDYPLFFAALRKCEELQPDPQEILNHMISASLAARMELFDFTIAIERIFPQPILHFQDNFAFLIGRRRNI